MVNSLCTNNEDKYFIQSKWDGQWNQLSNSQLELINDKLVLVYEDSKGKMYTCDIDGQKISVLYSNPNYVAFRNRVTDFSYRVEVKINNQYLPARPHQIEALKLFIETSDPDVEVPHPSGGMFKATFYCIDDTNYKYVTEDNNEVLMKLTVLL